MKPERSISKLWRKVGKQTLAAVLFALLLSAVALAGSGGGQGKGSRFVGTWSIVVTPRNCETGAQVAPTIRSLATVAEGGTLIVSNASLSFAPNQRSESHGVWHQLSAGVFEMHTAALLRFDTAPAPPNPGFLAGWEILDHEVTLVDRNHYTSAGTASFYDTQGELYRVLCSTTEAVRFL